MTARLLPLLLGAALAFAAGAAEIRLTADPARPAGSINRKLAGVSQGGNAGSFFKEPVLAGLNGFPLTFVRIEMITASRPHALYDAAAGRFDWTKLDAEIEAVQRAGGEVIINFFGTPRHLASDPGAKIPAFTPPGDFRAYADFCAEIVRHVNIEKKYAVKYWEFWNEPSGNHFWTDWNRGSDRFFELYALVAKAVKKADPSALVGGFGDNAQYPEHYRRYFRSVKKNRAPLDFLTIHYYGDWAGKNAVPLPGDYAEFSDRLLRICRKELGRELPLFYTEWNLPAESVNRFPAEQVAAWAGAGLARMQENGRIGGAAFFRIENYRDPHSSLLDPAGNPRTAWRVLSGFASLPERRVAARSSSDDTTVIAAGDAAELHLQVSRYNPDEKAGKEPARLLVKNLGQDTEYEVSVLAENAENAARTGKPGQQTALRRTDAAGSLEIPFSLERFEVVRLTLKRR